MEKLKKLVANILGLEINQITDETSPENTDAWDSFNGLMMVSELENTFNVKFTMDEITSVTCFKDIKEALKKHGVNIQS